VKKILQIVTYPTQPPEGGTPTLAQCNYLTFETGTLNRLIHTSNSD
jgi:hypothetical protein